MRSQCGSENGVTDPENDAADDGGAKRGNGQILRERPGHSFQAECRKDQIGDQSQSQCADGEEEEQRVHDSDDDAEENAGDDTFRPESAVKGDAVDDGKEEDEKERVHQNAYDEALHDYAVLVLIVVAVLLGEVRLLEVEKKTRTLSWTCSCLFKPSEEVKT